MTPEQRVLLATTRLRLGGIETDLEAMTVGVRLEGIDLKLAYRVGVYVNAARRNLLSAAEEIQKEVDRADG